MAKPLLIVIVGPTAVGKTAVAIALAQMLNAEVVSADSRQVFKELNIGTAKPTPEELKGVPHHFINSHSIYEDFSAGRFEEEAQQVLDCIFSKHKVAILVGGSGLYIKALLEGLDAIHGLLPGVRAELKNILSEKGLAPLLEELQKADPTYYNIIDRANPQRVIRALEVIRSTNEPYSSFRRKTPNERSFRTLHIGLEMPRGELYHRIDARIDAMLERGLVAEAKELYPLKYLNALNTVGYKEIFKFLDKEITWNECVHLLKKNSRQYAKRQLTWFKKDPHVTWFSPHLLNEIKSYVQQHL